MFGVGFVEAMRAPFQDSDWLRKFVLGGLLSLVPNLAMALLIDDQVPWVLVPVLFIFGLVLSWVVWGYLYRIFVDALNGQAWHTLPEWGNWKAYSSAGLRVFLIVLGYILLTGVGLTGLLSILGMFPSGKNPEQLSAVVLLVMLAVMLLYGFLPIAFARFAAEGRVWAAFDPWALWADIRALVKGDYVQTCLAFYGLWLMGNLVLGWLPYVGLPLVSTYSFYVMVVFARLFGRMIGVEGQKALSSEGR